MKRTFSVVVERDEDRYYVASVPELPGCHTQAKTLDGLIRRIKEAILLYEKTRTPILQIKINPRKISQ